MISIRYCMMKLLSQREFNSVFFSDRWCMNRSSRTFGFRKRDFVMLDHLIQSCKLTSNHSCYRLSYDDYFSLALEMVSLMQASQWMHVQSEEDSTSGSYSSCFDGRVWSTTAPHARVLHFEDELRGIRSHCTFAETAGDIFIMTQSSVSINRCVTHSIGTHSLHHYTSLKSWYIDEIVV